MKNKKQIIIVSILALLSMLIVVFGFMPIYNKTQAAQAELHEERIALAQQKQQSTDIAALNNQFNKIQDNADKLNEAFIKKDTASVLTFIDTIESLSSMISLEENLTISPLPQSENDGITSSDILLSVSGGYTSLYRFLQALEQQPYYLTFKTLDITSSSDTQFTMTLGGLIYWE